MSCGRMRRTKVTLAQFTLLNAGAAYAKIHHILRDIEREWSRELGPKNFALLKVLLCRVWESPLAR